MLYVVDASIPPGGGGVYLDQLQDINPAAVLNKIDLIKRNCFHHRWFQKGTARIVPVSA